MCGHPYWKQICANRKSELLKKTIVEKSGVVISENDVSNFSRNRIEMNAKLDAKNNRRIFFEPLIQLKIGFK